MVRISTDFGIVIRRSRLAELNLSVDQVLDALSADVVHDESEALLSLGPHFGSEAAEGHATKLTELGLQELEDFFVFRADMPDWAQVSCGLAQAADAAEPGNE